MDIRDLLRSEAPQPPSVDSEQNPSLEIEQDLKASSTRTKKCPHCDKTFRGGNTLNRHVRSHDPKNRIFVCRYDGCNRKVHGFFRREHLLLHEYSVHSPSSSKVPIRRRRSDSEALSSQNLLSDLEMSDNGGELNELDNTREATAERQFTVVNAQALASTPGLVVTDPNGNRVEAEQDLDSMRVILERLRSLEMRVESLERQRADT